MTREQLDDLEKLLSTATPAPWWAQREYDSGRTVCQMRHQTETVCVNRAAHVEGNQWDAHWANANPIQDLRNNSAELIALAREALELREALEYVANLRSAYWSRPTENKWRLIETDCGAMIIRGEGSTPLEAINNARKLR